MTTTEEFDERYVRFREHADLRERVTELAGAQTQTLDSLRRIETILTSRPVTPAPAQETAMAAVLHRALDAADKRTPSSGTHPILNALAMVGALAIAGVIVALFLGIRP